MLEADRKLIESRSDVDNAKRYIIKAFDNYEICLRIRKERGDPDHISYPLSGLGWLYFQKKDYKDKFELD